MPDKAKNGEEDRQNTDNQLRKARQNLKEILERIKPFARRREFAEHSTAGQWRETSSWMQVDSQDEEANSTPKQPLIR